MTHRPSPFTFGCMSLGSDLTRIAEHVQIAHTAMDAKVWFHASPTYNRGFTYMIARMAFDEARHLVPPMIIKIRCGIPHLLQFEVEDTLRRLGIETIDVAQLVFTETGGHGPLVNDFLHSGPIAELCATLKSQGKVKQFCPQLDAPSSPAFVPLVQKHAFDGYVLYLNPLERDVDDAMWDLLQKQQAPLWALRTVAGALGEPDRLTQLRQKQPNHPHIPITDRVAPLAAGTDWTEFCIRYAAGIPNLQTTIGGTADLGHLQHFLHAASNAKPLSNDLMNQIDSARKGT